MKHREISETEEQRRLKQLRYIIEHWDKLPKTMQCRFEGQVQTANDFLMLAYDTPEREQPQFQAESG